MNLVTDSGIVKVNKRSPYGKWLLGYLSTGSFSGAVNLDILWSKLRAKKPIGCDWFAYGIICGSVVYPLYHHNLILENRFLNLEV